MPYMCKQENIANLTPKIKSKLVQKTTYSNDNWINLELDSTRYQVISVSDVANVHICLPYWHAEQTAWRARVYNITDLSKATSTTVNALVVYLDFGSALYTPSS